MTARQTILSVHDDRQLEAKVDLPESMLRGLRLVDDTGKNDSPQGLADRVKAWAKFDGLKDRRFELTPKELSTKADARTQTFEATFALQRPADLIVLPGMTATVTIDFSALSEHAEVHWVPASAVVADSGLEPHVWVLNPADMTVSKRAVTVGRLDGEQTEILGGVEDGEEIVSVDAAYLAEHMAVRRMPVSEQAQPRADDPH